MLLVIIVLQLEAARWQHEFDCAANEREKWLEQFTQVKTTTGEKRARGTCNACFRDFRMKVGRNWGEGEGEREREAKDGKERE